MASRASAPSRARDVDETRARDARANHRRTMTSRVSRVRGVARASNGAGDEEFRASVDGLREPCDDFVCKSSPAVENTLKSLIKDVNACARDESKRGAVRARRDVRRRRAAIRGERKVRAVLLVRRE